MRYLQGHSCVICAHELIFICCIVTGIFGGDQCLAVTCKVYVAVGGILTQICSSIKVAV